MAWDKVRADARPNLTDGSLAHAPSMVLIDDSVEDLLAPGGVNLPVSRGYPENRDSIFGPVIHTKDADDYLKPGYSSLDATRFTVETLARVWDDVYIAGDNVIRDYYVYHYFLLGKAGSVDFQFFLHGGWQTITHNGVLDDGMLHYYVGTFDSATGIACGYIDGVLVASLDTGDVLDPANFRHDLRGGVDGGCDYFLGLAIYDEVKDAAWVQQRWNRLHNAIRYRQRFDGVVPGTYNTSRFIPGTPFYLDSGTVVIEQENISGRPTMVMRCTSAATLYLYPDGHLNGCLGPEKEAAFGEWEFWHWNNGTHDTRIDPAGRSVGYPAIVLDNADSNYFFRHFVGGTEHIFSGNTEDEWVKWRFRIERKLDTSNQYRMTLWRNGMLIDADPSNPSIWYSSDPTSTGCRIDLGRDNKLVLASRDGQLTFLKRPTWEVGE